MHVFIIFSTFAPYEKAGLHIKVQKQNLTLSKKKTHEGKTELLNTVWIWGDSKVQKRISYLASSKRHGRIVMTNSFSMRKLVFTSRFKNRLLPCQKRRLVKHCLNMKRQKGSTTDLIPCVKQKTWTNCYDKQVWTCHNKEEAQGKNNAKRFNIFFSWKQRIWTTSQSICH